MRRTSPAGARARRAHSATTRAKIADALRRHFSDSVNRAAQSAAMRAAWQRRWAALALRCHVAYARHELRRTRAAFDDAADRHRRLTAQLITLAATSRDLAAFVRDDVPWISECLTALASDMDARIAEHAHAARQLGMHAVVTQGVH